MLDLPWEVPLAEWEDPAHRFRELPVGPSRHLVRFLVHDGLVYALKELPAPVATREFEVLRHLEEAGLPAVRAVGLAERPEQGDAIVVTEYLAHSLQYRRLLMRLRLGQPISDGTSGLYAVNHRALDLLADPYVCEAPEVEALVRITDAKLRLLEVPVHMRQREHGESSFRGRRAVELVVTIGLTLFAGELLRRRLKKG